MNNDVKQMLQKIIIYDLIIAIIFSTLIYFTFKKYSVVLFLGLFIALINFVINTILINYAVNVGKIKSISLASFIFRIVITAFIGFLFYKNNKYNVIAYVFGYTLHFIPLILYSINVKNK
ncbi:ATP synthase I chain [Clostridium acetireducens DSM 10703]|uniref:ATP synthase I chain n=1 Tax=Clostridium acetireducens DSM 10703 TaxID=1121290 RepID=A0A1E8EYX9_9CLOT|nr:ATP synthase subunit I [Clostridium acetireducens]OFI06206.1 ATP synthase I chain [Clostridium acetireducens DSM 10703]